MDWQPELSGRWRWFEDPEARDQPGPAAMPASAGSKRWVIHGAQGGRGSGVASSSYGPHVTPKPGQGGH